MTKATMFVCFVSAAWCFSVARADTFGTGANTFDIEFVHIGDPDNPDDTTGNPSPVGKVEYAYRMGKFEISEDMINKSNSLGGLGISHQNFGPAKPATRISWFEAATFVNWLNTSAGHTPAYKFKEGAFELWQSSDEGYNPDNPFRNTQASYFLPSVDEWYKAAYYDPIETIYYTYPTGSDTAPVAVVSGTAANTAVFDHSNLQVPAPADITLAGGLSPYGTMAQGGNVWEWEETEFDLLNDSTSSARGNRGGDWFNESMSLLSSVRRSSILPQASDFAIGFRVASVSAIVPEPSAITLALLASLLVLKWRRR